MSVRDTPPAPGASPTGANEGLFGILQTFVRSPQFGAVLAEQFGLVRAAPGDLKATATVDAPPGGWLLCDATLYATATYPALSAVLFKAGFEQLPYNAAPPAGQFYVPDLRHVTLVGADPQNGSGLGALALADFGGYFGRALNTLSAANLPAHTHPTSDGASFLESAAGVANAATGTVRIAGTQFQPTTGSTGSGTGFTAMPPFSTVNFWIKT